MTTASSPDYERKTQPVPYGLKSWEHPVAIKIDGVFDVPNPTAKPTWARCVTRHPATRCDCGMFDLWWQGPRGAV